MLKHFILFGGVLGLLTACGGGGGGGGNNPPVTSSSTSTVSSSSLSSSSANSLSSSSISSSSLVSSSSSSPVSSSSSSSSVDPCNNTSGTIFSECLNTSYGYIIGAQYAPSYIEYITSTDEQQVQWSILDTDTVNNKVLDVRLTDSARKGQIVIGHPDSNPGTQDLSQFQTGSLKFDIRVTNFGDAFDPLANGIVFSARMDCLWPCSSHEAQIVAPTLDTWMTVTIPISDLIATGLDVNKVSASLVLVPRGNQANLHFQLDNIQLVKGTAAVEPSTVILREDFNTKGIPQWQLTNAVGNPSASATTNYGFGATLFMNWLAMSDALRFETTLDTNIDITNSEASFQINCWSNTNRNFTFQMIATDANGITTTTRASDGTSINTDNWYTVSAQLGSVFDNSFDPTRVAKFGVQFVYLGVSASTTSCQVDTIRIKPSPSVAILQ